MIENGYIFRLEENEAVIMTRDYDFYKVKRRSDMIALGQEITFSNSDIVKVKKSMFSLTKYRALALSAAAAAIILFSLVFFQITPKQSDQIYAYIDIDTNLSLRLAIDDKNKVLDVNPINEDTRVLMEGLHLEKKNINDAIADIIQKSKEKGFSSPDESGCMLISAALNDENEKYKKSKEKEEQKLASLLDVVDKDVDTANLTKKVIKVEPEIKKLASDQNVSMGRYIAYMETKEHGLDMTIDEARKSPINDIINKADTNKDNTMADASSDVSFNDGADSNTNKNTPNTGNKNTVVTPNPDKTYNSQQDKVDHNYSHARPSLPPTMPVFTNTPENKLPYYTPIQTPVATNGHATYPNVWSKPPIIYYPYIPFIPYNPTIPYRTPSPTKVWPSMQMNSPTPLPSQISTGPVYTHIPVHPSAPVYTPKPVHTPSPTDTPVPVNTPVPTPTIAPFEGNKILAYAASDITSSSAILSGEVVSMFGSNSGHNVNYFVVLSYWETNNPWYIHTATSTMSGNLPVKLTATVKGLKPNTDYFFNVTVNGYFSSNLQSFKTLPLTTNTDTATNATPTPNTAPPTMYVPWKRTWQSTDEPISTPAQTQQPYDYYKKYKYNISR